MALRELIEDELILALPYRAAARGLRRAAPPADEAGSGSPFAGLRGLMRSKH